MTVEYAVTAEHLFCHPGAEVMDLTFAASLDRQWGWHIDRWKYEVRPGCASGGVGLPDPLTMTVEEWSVHPPAHHLPNADWLLDTLLEHASDGEVDEGWHEDATEACGAPAAQAVAEALLAVIATGIKYRMAADEVARWSVTRTARYADGHSGRWVIEDTEPLSLFASTPSGDEQ